jgi:integrase
LHRALKKAVRDRKLKTNPAADLEGVPAKPDSTVGAREHCWSAVDARRFLDAAQQADAQICAYMVLALDSGARRSELDGLVWTNLDLDRGIVTFARQLDRAGVKPEWGDTKTKRIRTIPLGPETVAALILHRQHQNELKLRNGPHYVDFGLVFAKEDVDLQRPAARLGQPIQTLGGAKFHVLVKKAGVPRIRFHGVRHTVATLLLAAGVPATVVAKRLGHATTTMTLNIYGHADSRMQEQATSTLSSVLFGGGVARSRA